MLSTLKYIFLSLLLGKAFTAFGVVKTSSKTIKFVSAKTTYNEDYIREYTVSIGSDNRTLDLAYGVSREIPLDACLVVTLALRGLQPQFMFRHEFNICNFFNKAGTRMRGFLTPWLKKVLAESKMPNSCPIQEGYYYWNGLTIANFNIPSFVPQSQYDVTVVINFRKNGFKEEINSLYLGIDVI